MTAHNLLDIRQAEPRDFAAIGRIEALADRLFIEQFAPESWPAATSAAERLEQGGFILVGEIGSEVDDEIDAAGTELTADGVEAADHRRLVGFAHVIEADGIAHLEQVSVLPEAGRRGYGRLLVEAAMRESRSRGYSELTLRTYADLPWNAPFYLSLGFEESPPRGRFLQGLVLSERAEGLERYGRRVQMTVQLGR